MSSAIIWDLILVGQIELNRGAIMKAVQFTKNTLLLNVHITMALLTVLLYGIMICTGRRLLRGKKALAPAHRRLGLITLGFRLFVYVTSFLIVE